VTLARQANQAAQAFGPPAYIWVSTDFWPAVAEIVDGFARWSGQSSTEHGEVVTTVVWQDGHDELHDKLGDGVETLWSLLHAAQAGVIGLALMLPLDDGAGFDDAATNVMLALDELELVRPELMLVSFTADLGPVDVEDIGGYQAAIVGLLQAAGEHVALLARNGLPGLETSAVLALATVASLAGTAERLVVGRVA